MRQSPFLPLACAMFLVGTFSEGSCKKAAAIDDIAGVWHLVEVRTSVLGTDEGALGPDSDVKDCTILVKDGVMTWNEKGKAQFSFKLRVETAMKCIHVIEKDTLRVSCHHGVSRFTFSPYVHPDLPRPKNFGPGEPPTVMLMFKRAIK